ncbi:hypothetical protein FRC04_008823 [Tulasnella sp. 424]|nr:hypothetical protein FRC04_008823 [Tulasnella sp. 424]KAG8980050.1 hypothetical protein FRC05_007493 [Tulasnella sp. 425]
MRFTTPFFLLSFIASSTLANSGTPAPPASYYVMSGIIDIASPIQIPNTVSGTRVSIPFTGGNFTDSKGEVIGNIVPCVGGENGFVDSAGVFNPDGRATVKFLDGTYAYLQHMGKGSLTDGVADIAIKAETNSGDFKFLNKAFLFAHLKIIGAALHLVVFSTTKPS